MAGNYPDASSHRMAYDKDGTQVYWRDGSSTLVQQNESQIGILNDEADTVTQYVLAGGLPGHPSMVFIFPELRDLNGFFIAEESGIFNAPIYVETSANSTNGIDGTWTQISSTVQNTIRRATKPLYREAVTTTTALGIRAVRFRWGDINLQVKIRAIHLYGSIATGQNPNRLALWHPSLDQRVGPAHFDWGDVPRNSSDDVQFRVKNMSATLTADDVAVSVNALTDTTPSVPGQHYLSLDEETWTAQVEAGDIGPGGTTGIITLRRVTPANAVLSLWSFRLFAEADSWGV